MPKKEQCREQGGIWDDDTGICYIVTNSEPSSNVKFHSGVNRTGLIASVIVSMIGILLYVYGISIEFFELPRADMNMVALGIIAIGLAGLLGSVISIVHGRVRAGNLF